MQAPVTGIDEMPRGGPDASCLDRLLWTDRSEYLDRSDVDPAVKRSVIDALNWTGRVFGSHEQFAAIALEEIADVPDPRILELGAGHGALTAKLLEFHPSAHVTVTDIGEDAVTAMAAGPLGEHPRATVRVVDATSIDAPDRQFSLAVFALSFHHLAPAAAAAVLAEGTRVADKLLIIDLPRPPAPVHVLRLASMLPLAPFIPFVHDGVISSLRSYSPSALRALADHAGVDIELRNSLFGPQIAVATRR
ncbi:class I SAM-dependent methyltransferase [Mycolicibacterium neoaurum]|uniref:class I SAM-dependent methyltransferase n=1 Tax=Mycolicibacterium neoaurum TaxID=1795 RepID=UPI002671C76E|nr:class I SAM-dependent methyltransferase [Mycolicibacterium neoaurum]MDO3399758.1 class I SAM-dependent methyltransferase [Mycolicibacterium neoaurum]